MYRNFGIYKYTFSCRIASTIFLAAYSGSIIGNRKGQLGGKKNKNKNEQIKNNSYKLRIKRL